MQMRPNVQELDRIRLLLRHMSRRSRLYKVVKEELKARGNWKNKAGARPGRGWAARARG